MRRGFAMLPFCFLVSQMTVIAQNKDRPSIAVRTLEGSLVLDGHLDEEDWQKATFTDEFKTTVPIEQGDPSGITELRVLADSKTLIIGIQCEDDSPNDIVRYSKLRDASLENEDHVRIVIDPFLDGQSGYIFAVNANGARYDALVSNRGESENANWDAVWEAAAVVHDKGWSVEIRIPIQSIAFKKGLTQWGFNIERHIQRKQENIRWANVYRDQWLIQTSRAGLITSLPAFDFGTGLNVRPSLVGSSTHTGEAMKIKYDFQPSLDMSQRIGPNILATLTANTDFAETEVDTRQTNLTRFPLFFPEKRSFFLEGSDIFEFGFGTGRSTVLPFFSRRIGLYQAEEVPILGGLKLNGRTGKTAFGGMGIRTRELESADTLSATTMGVVRLRQNIFKESTAGIIASAGDPQGRDNSWMSGADFTYQTTSAWGDNNFLIGAWGLVTNREDLTGDRSAIGIKIDYPNDRWDCAFTYSRIGEDFDPSLGFVPRKGIHYLRGGLTFAPRPQNGWLRQMFHQFFGTYITELDGNWQSYNLFMAPINWRFESGDRFELNVNPQGENLGEAFNITDNVSIPAGKYNFIRYRIEAEFAAKRRLNGQLTWWTGSFYDGTLNQFNADVKWIPSQLVTFEFTGVRNIGRLPWGDFNHTLAGLRIRFNVTPDLQLNSFLQYDTESRELGWNARIHWIYNPLGDIFFVYNHNVLDLQGPGWELQSSQLVVKLRYNFRI